MAHFAKLDSNNVVTFVVRGREEDDGKELELSERTGDVYRRTSYNTHGGVHYTDGKPSKDQSKAFRKNYAGVGYTYDEALDGFIPPKPYESWSLNEDTYQWEAPIPYPAEGDWLWDEQASVWVEVEDEAG